MNMADALACELEATYSMISWNDKFYLIRENKLFPKNWKKYSDRCLKSVSGCYIIGARHVKPDTDLGHK
jgi:hypothetical protein